MDKFYGFSALEIGSKDHSNAVTTREIDLDSINTSLTLALEPLEFIENTLCRRSSSVQKAKIPKSKNLDFVVLQNRRENLADLDKNELEAFRLGVGVLDLLF